MHGIKRNLEDKIKCLLQQFPVVAILGVRQSGKTTIAKNVASDWDYFDLENARDYERISHDLDFFFNQYNKHVIIDEAQEYPLLFKTLRGVIDQQRAEKGRFILTGSSNPELLDGISESLAGRVAIVELGTLKANEYYQQPQSEFYHLFSNTLSKKLLVSGDAPLNAAQMQKLWLYGGYPEPVLQSDINFYNQWMDNYSRTYINYDIAKLFPKLNKLAYRRFLHMLGQLSGTIINKRDLARSVEISEKTIKEYLDIAEGTFLWRKLLSYEKNVIKKIVKMPKGHLRDTGFLHYLMQINNAKKLYAHPLIGRSFETFVIEELIKGLNATMVTNWRFYYYRTRNGAEIDLILEGPFGILPIEIKYGTTVKMRQLSALTNFIKEHHLPFGIVINQSQKVEWLTPNIVQIPIGWL